MPMKGSGTPTLAEIDRSAGGVGWLAFPDEDMQRASHALATEEGVYLVDPVDADGLDDLLAEFGDVAGCVVLLDRHNRDADTIARRHDVPVYRPRWMDSIDSNYRATVEDLGSELGTTGYEVHELYDTPVWREAYLYHPDERTLVVPEALGTATYFRAGDERVGVHPMLRMTPPRDLARFDVERLRVGHGAGVTDRASNAVRDAIEGSRRRAPKAYLGALRGMLD
ncbi:hypothetical protein [Halomarina oriensis]|uniref:MBL fold metallo-hydrolase n=1 Tax=Halomarina oriensis TaxID=671145 RepID=A0A6B0GSU1_9EURY|nr:hypothetical protein [Halomarina oriensis]MWG35703.1 hypothetical protein [Halomarina oriensis]